MLRQLGCLIEGRVSSRFGLWIFRRLPMVDVVSMPDFALVLPGWITAITALQNAAIDVNSALMM